MIMRIVIVIVIFILQHMKIVVVVVMLPVDTTMAVMCHVLFCLLHALSWLRMPMRLLHVLPQCRHM